MDQLGLRFPRDANDRKQFKVSNAICRLFFSCLIRGHPGLGGLSAAVAPMLELYGVLCLMCENKFH